MSEKLKWKKIGHGSFTMRNGRTVKPNEIFEATEDEIPKAFRDIIRPLASLPKVEARAFIHRRYPEGKNFEYDTAFETRFNASPILNDKNRSYMDPMTWQVTSKGGLEGLLIEWQEKAERAADLLGKIDAEFENLKVRARRMGKPEPETMPQALLEEKYKAEARADVTNEEIDKIKGIIAKREAPEKEAQDDRVLKYGPCGSGHGDPLREIDGQKVVADDEGILIIDSPRSPYHLMRVSNYRTLIVKPFGEARSKAISKPITPEEKAAGRAHRPLAPAAIAWENLPPRPKGF